MSRGITWSMNRRGMSDRNTGTKSAPLIDCIAYRRPGEQRDRSEASFVLSGHEWRGPGGVKVVERYVGQVEPPGQRLK